MSKGHRRPPEPCAEPGCGALSRSRSRRCPAHEKIHEQEQAARKGTAASRGYDATWRRLSLAVRRAEPLCRRCAAAGLTVRADVVDHIIPLEERPDLRLVQSNLQPLCHACHSGAKQREERAARRGGIREKKAARRQRWWE